MEGRRSRCDSNGGVGAPEPRNAVISGLFVCKKNDNFKEKIAVQNEKKLRNKTLQNFARNNLNKTDLNDNKAYETLEYQLNDMEQHLQKIA